MAWAKLDDQFFYNKKIAQVDGMAKLLYIAGLVYVANQLTDGFIPERAVKFIASTADVANCQEFAKQLLDVGLWVATDDGYQIHDYLAWNPSKEQAERTKEARSESGRRGGLAKAAKDKQTAGNLPSKPLAKSKQKSAPSPSLINSPSDEGEHPQKRSEKSRDPLLDHPAVIAYRERWRITANTEQRRTIAATVTDTAKWDEVMRAWQLQNYRPDNVAGMLDWYVKGIPTRSNGNGARTNGQSALATLKAREPRAAWNPTPDELARAQAEWDAAPTGAQLRAGS